MTVERSHLTVFGVAAKPGFADVPAVPAFLLDFTCADQVSDRAGNAVHWAVAQKLLQASGGVLLSRDTDPRARAAAILVRYLIATGK